MRSFLTLLSGNAASTGISFLTAIVLARTLTPSGFVLTNLLLTLMVAVALAGGGVDTAAIRLIARGSNDVAAVRAAVAPRVACFVVVAAASPFVVLPANSSAASNWLAVSAFLALGAGISVVFLALIEPIAHGRPAAFSRRQVYFYSALAVCSLAGLRGALEPVLIGFSVVGLATLAVGVAWIVRQSKAELPFTERREFRRLIPTFLIATIGFAIFDRVDVILVSSATGSRAAAEFAVAARFAGGLALVTGAFAAFATPKVAQAVDAATFRRARRGLLWPFVLVVAATGVAIPVELLTLPFLFGAQYEGSAGVAAAILSLQFPLAAFQMAYIIAFPHIGNRRWLIEHVCLLIVIKVGVVMLVPDSSVAFAFAAPTAHGCGCVYVLWRATQFNRSA